MIQWVDEECKAWGAHKRWLKHAVMGYPARSVLGRLIEEGPGAGHEAFHSSVPVKDPPPQYLSVNLALTRMALTHELEGSIIIIHAHYVEYGRVKQKAPALGISLKQYWSMLHTAHAFIAGCADVPRGTSVCTQNRAGNRVHLAA